MNDARNGSRWSTLAWGLILIVVGGLFLAEELEVADFSHLIRDYWPLLLIVFGIVKLFARESRGGGLTMIAVGSWLQVANLGLFGFDWSSWPLLLILIGVGIILHAILDAAIPRREESEGGGPHAPQA
ncbi:MAG TPA: DUF5668 domain-containing protein [Thermoanaerobaculia bacterium]|nr:DUF5668 domain-containing protein [Thermoanaerobaculia bacterium]